MTQLCQQSVRTLRAPWSLPSSADNDYFQSNLDNGQLGKNDDACVAKREHEDYVECPKVEAELHSRCKVAFQ